MATIWGPQLYKNLKAGPGIQLTQEGQDATEIEVKLSDTAAGLEFDESGGLKVSASNNADLLRQELASPSDPLGGANIVAFDQGTVYNRLKYTPVSPEFFGAVGNGIVDDLLPIRAALLSGLPLIFAPGKVYRVTDRLDITNSINLNGSELRFELDGWKFAGVLKDNAEVINGTVTVVGTNPGGGGQLQCPLVAGDYDTGDGYRNISLRNLIIQGNRPNGNGILITGDSNNIAMENIYFPDNQYMGRPILVHWGGAGFNPPQLTTHPYNISMKNIYVGNMSSTFADGSAIFLSATYNITVDNLFIKSSTSTQGAIGIFGGDYGDYYAAANVKGLILENIYIKNVIVEDVTVRAVRVRAYSTDDPELRRLPGPTLENIVARSKNPALTAYGIEFSNTTSGKIIGGSFEGFQSGIRLGEASRRIKVDKVRIQNSVGHGIIVDGLASDIIINECISQGSGTGNATSAGVYCTGDVENIKIRDCELGKASGETQLYGVRVTDNTSNVEICRNTVKGVRSGGIAYSLASTSALGQVSLFNDNIAAAGITFKGGAGFLPIRQGGSPRLWIGPGRPSTGTWQVGDRVQVTAPLSGGGFMEWVCSVAGTPGTWIGVGAV